MSATVFGIVNAHMLGAATAPGEHVDWSTPDYFTAEDYRALTGEDVLECAEHAPHLIIFVADGARP